MPDATDIPSSRHFRIHTITNGVYTAIHMDGGWSISNSGIIDLGGKTLVFDTGLTPEAARDLKTSAEILTGRPVDYVVNSHYHKDHIRGNQVFKDAHLISTQRTQSLIFESGVRELESDVVEVSTHLEELRNLAQQSDPKILEYVRLFLPYWQGINESLGEIEIHIPDHTFSEREILSGTKRSIEILDFGGGHSESDCVLHLPEDGVLFCGDLLFAECHPFMGESNPEVWISILNKLEELDAEVCVPGHGDIGTSKALTGMASYIHDIVDLVQDVVRGGGQIKDALAKPVPSQYSDWLMVFPFYELSIKFLYEKHKKSSS